MQHRENVEQYQSKDQFTKSDHHLKNQLSDLELFTQKKFIRERCEWQIKVRSAQKDELLSQHAIQRRCKLVHEQNIRSKWSHKAER